MAGEADGAEDVSTNAALAAADPHVTPEGGVREHEEGGDRSDPSFQEDQRAEVLKEPLDVTSTSEQQLRAGASVPPVEAETSCSAVRQRRRRRAKKAAQ